MEAIICIWSLLQHADTYMYTILTANQIRQLSRLFLEALGDGAPVDDVPDGAEVLGLAVLVLQVVGVLPGVDAQQGLEVARDGVLVRAGDEAERARRLVLDEPGPAGALDAGEGRVGLLLEVLERAEVFVDGGLHMTYFVSNTAQGGEKRGI
jgi:hypothetical protein